MTEEKWDLSLLDSGGRSALKRNAGIMMGNDMMALEAFWRAAQNVPRGQEKIWYACMCFDCLWRAEDHPEIKPFEEMLRSIYQDRDTSESIQHRIISITDVPWGEDGFLLGKLANFIRMMKAKNAAVKPDFQKLSDDLRYWNASEHKVQRRWIETICRYRKEDTMQNKEEVNYVD